MCQNNNLPFRFFVSSKIQVFCRSVLQTGTWNQSNYSGYFQKISASFLKFKGVIQQNDMMKYSSFARVVKKRKV